MSSERAAAAAAAMLALAVCLAGAGPVRADRQSTARTVYLSVTDESGAPVMDLRPDEFELKEGGRTLPVAKADPATGRLRIAVIVSDGGTGAFQSGVADFVQNMLSYAEISLVSVIIQPLTLVDYTSEVPLLRDGVLRLGVRARAPSSAQLLEAIMDAARTVKGEAAWRPSRPPTPDAPSAAPSAT
jgi:hypothetical protein